MAEIYLDPMIIGIAVTIVIAIIGIFDFLPYKKETQPNNPKESE